MKVSENYIVEFDITDDGRAIAMVCATGGTSMNLIKIVKDDEAIQLHKVLTEKE